jgi:hypothetical protein
VADERHIIEIDAAWAAGFLDGEGSFQLKSRRGGLDYSPYINAAQIDLRPLEKLADLLGGKIYERPTPKKENHSRCWQWDLFGVQNIIRVVPIIRPYLVLKGEQADLIYKFALTMGKQGKSVRSNVFIMDERQKILDDYATLRRAA